MDNRKKALTVSGWSEGTGSGFRREPEIRKLAVTRNQPGLERRVELAHRFRIGADSKGINFLILLPLTTFVQLLSRAFRAPQR